MDFFIPEATSPEDAEHRWQAVKTFVEEPTGWTASDRRIQRLDYTHDGRDEVAEVGEQLEVIGEPVWAILDTRLRTADRVGEPLSAVPAPSSSG